MQPHYLGQFIYLCRISLARTLYENTYGNSVSILVYLTRVTNKHNKTRSHTTATVSVVLPYSIQQSVQQCSCALQIQRVPIIACCTLRYRIRCNASLYTAYNRTALSHHAYNYIYAYVTDVIAYPVRQSQIAKSFTVEGWAIQGSMWRVLYEACDRKNTAQSTVPSTPSDARV